VVFVHREISKLQGLGPHYRATSGRALQILDHPVTVVEQVSPIEEPGDFDAPLGRTRTGIPTGRFDNAVRAVVAKGEARSSLLLRGENQMNRVYSWTASAVLIIWTLAPVEAAPKSKSESPAAEAQAIFEHIDAQSATVADTAFHLSDMPKTERGRGWHLEGLAVLREVVNKIGSELQSLEAERDSLSEWESKALDQVLPLIHAVADDVTEATNNFNSSQPHLWATSYYDDTAKASQQASQVSTILRDYLKLAKNREKETQLEHGLESPPRVSL
jgi:hypothetical protein